MNLRKVAIIGCGFVGSSSAFSLMQSGLFSEMVLIDVNHRKIYAPDFNLSEGDAFSVRGRGKFVLDSIGGRSRRDRLFVTLKKYK